MIIQRRKLEDLFDSSARPLTGFKIQFDCSCIGAAIQCTLAWIIRFNQISLCIVTNLHGVFRANGYKDLPL